MRWMFRRLLTTDNKEELRNGAEVGNGKRGQLSFMGLRGSQWVLFRTPRQRMKERGHDPELEVLLIPIAVGPPLDAGPRDDVRAGAGEPARSTDQPNGQSPGPTALRVLPGGIDGSTSHFFSSLLESVSRVNTSRVGAVLLRQICSWDTISLGPHATERRDPLSTRCTGSIMRCPVVRV